MTEALERVLRAHSEAAIERASQLAQHIATSATTSTIVLLELESALDDIDRYGRILNRIEGQA